MGCDPSAKPGFGWRHGDVADVPVFLASDAADPSPVRRSSVADPTRRAIIALVALQPMTPSAIADNFDSSRQTISKHIQILTECELLKQEQNGREIYYHFNPKKMKEIAAFIDPYRDLWEDRFQKLESIMKKYKAKK